MDYALEYGSDRLELQQDAFTGSRGCWWWMTCWPPAARQRPRLSGRQGRAELVGYAFVIELEGLAGRAALPNGVPVESLIRYS